MNKHPAYRAYLVRLWPTRRGGAADYHVAVQSAATGERRDFPDLESLLSYWRGLRDAPSSESAPNQGFETPED